MTKNILSSCKELISTYSQQVGNFSNRVKWAKKQHTPISEMDAETLEMLEYEITKTRLDLEDRLLTLELTLEKD